MVSQCSFDPYRVGAKVYRVYWAGGRPAPQTTLAAVGGVIDMASHGCPLLDTLHMVEYHPRVFEITTGLHPLYQVYPAARTHLRHLEYKYLVRFRALAREQVLLDIRLVAATSEHGDAIHDSISPYVRE
jgi:hypothetical protein